MQEKKVKKVSDYNLEPSKAVGNGSIASSSNSSSPKPYLANGGSPDRLSSVLSNDFSFPSEGIPSLHLPVVVVLNLFCNPTPLGMFRNLNLCLFEHSLNKLVVICKVVLEPLGPNFIKAHI